MLRSPHRRLQAAFALLYCHCLSAQETATTQPNIILVITDHQRYDTIERDGFRVLVVMRDGQPAVVDNPKNGLFLAPLLSQIEDWLPPFNVDNWAV